MFVGDFIEFCRGCEKVLTCLERIGKLGKRSLPGKWLLKQCVCVY